MAANYVTLGATQTTQVSASGDSQDVEQVNCQAVPSGVGFPVRAPLADFQKDGPGAIDPVATQLADALNSVASNPNVGTVQVEQVVNAQSQLVDTAFVTVQTDAGVYATTLEIPLATLVTADPTALISAQVDNLTAVENL